MCGGMGFHDFKVFNPALLARQAWRLIEQPDTLCARLLKTKYYPSGHLLDTAFIQDMSATWQGVVHGLELLKKGAIWRIGSGSMVKIWRDNWLPRAEGLKLTGMKKTCRLRWVSQFIDPVTRSWDEAIIRKYCFPHDADTILQIKLPQQNTDDFVAWQFESNGIFSVKSAYRLGLQPKLRGLSRGQSSAELGGDRSIWNLVWKAPVPQKIRVFAWRLATDTLAVAEKLNKRIPKVLPTCSVCGMEFEDAHHAMIRCTLARALQDEMRKVWHLPSEAALTCTGTNWVLLLLEGVNLETRVKLLFLLWHTWHHHNNVVHGDGKACIAASGPFLQNYIQSIKPEMPAPDACGKTPMYTPRSPVLGRDTEAVSKWQAPCCGWIKVNVDVGWDAASSSGGIGMIVRDAAGAGLYSEWSGLAACASAEEAELLACIRGIRYLMENPLQLGILESNCARIISVLSLVQTDRSAHWSLFSEAKELLNILPEVKLSKVGRGEQ